MDGSYVGCFMLLIIAVIISLVNLSRCDDSVQYRLPNTTVPTQYNIHIKTNVDRDEFKFSGNSLIMIQVRKSVKEIVLHSKKADITKVELFHNSINVDVINFTHNPINDFLTINVKNNLVENDLYELKISYTSMLRGDKLGFYRSSYLSDSGQTVWLAATQFAPTEARHAFPCYDEPQLKAIFKVEITHPKHFHAISNTDHEETVDNQDKTITTKFKNTPIMSTYLVGFVISDFESVLMNSKGFIQEIFVRKGSLNRTKFSGQYGRLVLQKFMDFFKENFPVDTMKHVAIPDFYFSGMENWGMVTYKDSTFLVDPDTYTTTQKLRAITLISHEMAHSWFGNLVTMHWWTYVWLKEGFSTLYAYYGADMVLPEHKIIELFLIEKMHYVFDVDGSETTRPMTHYVEKQNEIMENYDKIAYDKSACVLRMLDHALGHDVFKNGVDIYLKEHKFKTAEEDDLFAAFKKALPTEFKLDVFKALKTWTSQKGYPVLTVIRNYENPSITITQERFLNNGDSDDFSHWHIPVNFQIENSKTNFTNTKSDIWITKKNQKLTPEDIKEAGDTWPSSNWIILNKQQTGYYRVNYDIKNWGLITKELLKNHKNIHVNNRAQLIDDAFALAKAERLNYSIALNLINYMKQESEYAPWAAFDTNINHLKQHLFGTPSYRTFTKFIREITETPLSSLELTSTAEDIHLKRLTRKIIATHACEHESEKCHPERLSPKDPDMRALYYCNRMRRQTKQTYLEVRKVLRKTKDISVRFDILASFGCTSDKSMLALFLSSTIESPSDLKLTPEERVTLLKGIYQRGQLGLDLTFQFIIHDWSSIRLTFPSSSLESVIPDIAKYVNTQNLKQSFELVMKNIIVSPSAITLAKTRITSNFRWSILHMDDVDAFLKSSSSQLIALPGLVTFIIFLAKLR